MKIEFKKRETSPPTEVGNSTGDESYCPDLYLTNLDAADTIPDTGTATITYEIRRDSTTKADGKKSRDVSLEVHSIDFKGGGKKVDKVSAEDAVDKSLKDAEEESEPEEEE